jgi:hypothetical protein
MFPVERLFAFERSVGTLKDRMQSREWLSPQVPSHSHQTGKPKKTAEEEDREERREEKGRECSFFSLQRKLRLRQHL